MYKVYTYCCSTKRSHSELKGRYNFRTGFNLHYKGKGAQCDADRDKVQHNMFAVGERWPQCITQDQALRNTFPKLRDTLLKG